MSTHIVNQMVTDMQLSNYSSEEVFKFHATVLIDDFHVPPAFVVDMMHALKAASTEVEDV